MRLPARTSFTSRALRSWPIASGVSVELDDATKRPVLDLDLLIDPTVGLRRAPTSGDHQCAALDLELEVVAGDPGQRGGHHGPGRVVGVADVDRRGEPGSARGGERGTAEEVPEQLVDLPPHTLEVREQVALGSHRAGP